jgi:hypothetical protein
MCADVPEPADAANLSRWDAEADCRYFTSRRRQVALDNGLFASVDIIGAQYTDGRVEREIEIQGLAATSR